MPGTTDVKDLTERLLQLGDPGLRRVSQDVVDLDSPHFRDRAHKLESTLDAFRDEFGFGRAIAAPQLGFEERFIAVRLPHWPTTIINPVIESQSEERFTLWDDCMSFPFLLVKVRRATSISVAYTAPSGERIHSGALDLETSELLQHEIDHLDGVLAVDHAVDERSLVSRPVFEARLEYFRKEVDYVPSAYR